MNEVFWVIIIFIVFSLLASVFCQEFKKKIFSLWLGQMGVGALFLFLSHEGLALAQWLTSSSLSLLCVAYALVFGDARGARRKKAPPKRALSILSAFSFGTILFLGLKDLLGFRWEELETQRGSLSSFSALLTDQHPLLLIVLGIEILFVLIATHVIDRPSFLAEKGGF